jgi:hypothetical protein
MSRASIVGLDRCNEIIVSFRREPDNTYTKLTKTMLRNRTTGKIKHIRKNNPVIEDGPYRVVTDPEDYDEKMEYDGFDGKKRFLYFKKIEENEE